LPFELTNRPATFQYYMNKTLIEYLDNFCTVYLDDILIYSENLLEHTEHVCKVLLQLCKAGLQADIKKCEFNVICTKYLGFVVSTDGIEVDLEKVEVICNWKHLTTVKGVQSFLGFCNFYWYFIQNYSKTAASLTQLT
jgi:type III secretory pathway component EscU